MKSISTTFETLPGRPANAVVLALAAWPRKAEWQTDLSKLRPALRNLSQAAAQNKEVLRIASPDGSVTAVAFSPDGQRIVSGSEDGTLRLWDAQTGAPIGEPLRGHESFVASVAISPDGQRVVSGSWDNTLRLWDAQTGALIGEPLRGHEGVVTSVAFSPDGQRIVSGSGDNTLRLWDAQTGYAILLLGTNEEVFGVAFLGSSDRIVAGLGDGTLVIWNTKLPQGNLVIVACARFNKELRPKILETDNIDLGGPLCTGNEPAPASLTSE
ncbi:MAG TPA: WD40 repeat domain-containing protein [Roseibacterium sp.]|nr:WD40 repeat domain-containing protein [Roseibacterium sp.]